MGQIDNFLHDPNPIPPSAGAPRSDPEPSRRGQTSGIEINEAVTPAFTVVTKHEEVGPACEALEKRGRLGFDIETFGDPAQQDSALDPFHNSTRLIQLGTTDHVYLFDRLMLGVVPDLVRQMLEGRIEKVGHNLRFDTKCLLCQEGIEVAQVVDTLPGSVLAEGYVNHKAKGTHTLQALAHRYLGIELPKEQATSDWGQANLSNDQLGYAARDVSVVLLLAGKIEEEAKRVGVERAWGLENAAILPTVAMEVAGFHLDTARLGELIDKWREDAEAARLKVVDALGPINLNSPAQIKKAAYENLGIELPSTKGPVLRDRLGGHPGGRCLVEYRQLSKLVSDAQAWIDAADADGRVHATYNPLAAPTGRYGCSKPPLQSVPRDPVIRSCFCAPPDRRLVGADYSAIELRVIAEMIGDEELARCFLSGICPHKRTASFFLNKDIEDISKQERQYAKPFNFGLCFGQTAPSLVVYARDVYGVELTLKEAHQMRSRYFSLYRGIAAWHRRARHEGPRIMEARTASGRLERFQKFNYPQYLNMPVQGTAADGLKNALALLHPRLKPLGARLVHMVHDEVIVEAELDRAEEVKQVVEQALVEGMSEFLPTIPVEVKAEIGTSWADKP
ncbi:DNA polymerase [Myxococcota bacterium]